MNVCTFDFAGRTRGSADMPAASFFSPSISLAYDSFPRSDFSSLRYLLVRFCPPRVGFSHAGVDAEELCVEVRAEKQRGRVPGRQLCTMAWVIRLVGGRNMGVGYA